MDKNELAHSKGKGYSTKSSSVNQDRSCFEEGFVPILLLIVVVVLTGFVGSTNITTTKELTQLSASQDVLGEDEEANKVEEQNKEAAKKAEESQREEQKSQDEILKKQEEQRKEEQKSNTEALKTQKEENKFSVSSNKPSNSTLLKTRKETTSPTGFRSKTQTEGKKSETEIETADGQKIKTKVEDDGTTKVEIEQGQLKLKYVVENGQIILKAENEQGQTVELEDDDLNDIENEVEDALAEEGIMIATGSGKPILVKNNMAALTNFPLSIDVSTNQLIVTTPQGQRVVTVLPDEAVQNLLATNVINKIDPVPNANLTSDLGNLNGVVNLEIRNNEVVYRVKGSKTHNLLGLIPVDTDTTVFVSTETGQPVAQEQTVMANILDFLSPQ